MTRDEFAVREQSFARNTDSQLDEFIGQAQNLLENLTDQHGILKVGMVQKWKCTEYAHAFLPVENSKEDIGYSKSFGIVSKYYSLYWKTISTGQVDILWWNDCYCFNYLGNHSLYLEE